MGSALAWLDYSEYERRKALDVISLFRERETVDQLGVGSVRDALAERFFPGTSTIQTRARYFLFVPWIYRDLERLRTSSDRIAHQARQREIDLIEALERGGESEGIIGTESGAGLKQLPSSIYWSGLAVWGIRRFPGSQSQYHRSLDRYYETLRPSLRTDDGEPALGGERTKWHSNLPEQPADFLESTTHSLQNHEAEYLRERIVTSAPGTLMAHLADHGDIGDAELPWNDPAVDSSPQKAEVDHARNFSEAIYGASLLYNLMLARASENQSWIDNYAERFGEWAAALGSASARFAAWDRPGFWDLVLQANPRVPARTRLFVDAWLDLLNACDPASLADHSRAKTLIRDREEALKGPRAKLHNPHALQTWTGASGTRQLDFRWRIARRLLVDIAGGRHA